MNDWPVPDVRLSFITGESSQAIQIFQVGSTTCTVTPRALRPVVEEKDGRRSFCRVLHGSAGNPIATHFSQTDIVKEWREIAWRADDKAHQPGHPGTFPGSARQIACRGLHVASDRGRACPRCFNDGETACYVPRRCSVRPCDEN